FALAELAHARIRAHAGLAENLLARRQTDAKDVGQRDLDSLIAGKVDACDSCQLSPPAPPAGPPLTSRQKGGLSLALLVLRVLLADPPHITFTLDHLAAFAHLLDGRTHFHRSNRAFPSGRGMG